MTPASWGAICSCGHASLFHRGERHDGPCFAMACVPVIQRAGTVADPTCVAFSEAGADSTNLALAEGPASGADDDPFGDQDQPFERVREGAR